MTQYTASIKNLTINASITRSIKCYFIIIDFDGVNNNEDSNRDELSFENENDYGWKGLVVNDYQEAEEKLKEVISLNENPEFLIILSHGGICIESNKWAKNDLAFYTNHNSRQYLSTSKLQTARRKGEIEDDINKYEKLLTEIEERKIARKIREKIRFDRIAELVTSDFDYLDNNLDRCNTIIRYSTEEETDQNGMKHPKEDYKEYKISITEKDIEKLKKGKTVKIKDYTDEIFGYDFYGKSEEDSLQYYYTTKKNQLINTKGNITEQDEKDITSLKNILSLIVEGGTFFIASCHAAWVHSPDCDISDCNVIDSNEHRQLEDNAWKNGLIEEIKHLISNKINIVGITGTTMISTIPLGGGVAKYNARRNIGLEMTKQAKIKYNRMLNKIKNNEVLVEDDLILFNTFINPMYSNNNVIFFPSTYDLNDENRMPSIHKDIKIVSNGLELIN